MKSSATLPRQAGILRPALVVFAALSLVTGLAYPFLTTGIAAVLMLTVPAPVRDEFGAQHQATLTITSTARNELRARCARHRNGARMLDAIIDGELLPPLSLSVLQRLSRGIRFQRAELHWNNGAFAATLA